jgi:hypothetical protein
MKKTILATAAFSLLIATGCKNEAKHEDHAGTPAAVDSSAMNKMAEATKDDWTPPDSATMMKAWQAYMTPGDMHKWMNSMEGTWEAEMVSWMKPDAPPSPASKVKAKFKTILNGLYQESHYEGDMMGMKFEGKGLMAYDNARKKFLTSWIDNMGSGMLHMEGDWDESSKTLSFKGKSTDPVTGELCDFREVVRVTDDKHHVMEMYGQEHPGGKEFKMLEIRMTKK